MQINCFEIVIMFLQNNSRVFIRLHQIVIKKSACAMHKLTKKNSLSHFDKTGNHKITCSENSLQSTNYNLQNFQIII